MSFLSIIVTLVIGGILWWGINQYIPMDGKVRNILNVVAVVALVGWVLYGSGVFGTTEGIRLPEVN